MYSCLNIDYWGGRCRLAKNKLRAAVQEVVPRLEVGESAGGGFFRRIEGVDYGALRSEPGVRLAARELAWARSMRHSAVVWVEGMRYLFYCGVMGPAGLFLSGERGVWELMDWVGFGVMSGFFLAHGWIGVLFLVNYVSNLWGDVSNLDYVLAMSGGVGGGQVRLNEEHEVVYFNRVLEGVLKPVDELCGGLCRLMCAVDRWWEGDDLGREFFEFLNGVMQMCLNGFFAASLGVFMMGEPKYYIGTVFCRVLQLALLRMSWVALEHSSEHIGSYFVMG